MITIGLPKGMFYYQHSVLWENFFRYLGCNVVVSQDTNKEILDCGIEYCSNETCLPVKVFHGHVCTLQDKVDYIFIPRYTSLSQNEFTCPKFCGLPDMVRLNLKNKVNILEVKLNIRRSPEQTFKSLKKIAQTLNINYKNVFKAFQDAQKIFTENQKQVLAKKKLKMINSANKLVIAVLGHPYMIKDNYTNMKLIKKLTDRDVEVYTPENIDHETKRKNAYPFQGKVFWDVGLENIGSAYAFSEDDKVKGIIYLTPFACGVDSLVMEFIERGLNYKIPFMKLMVDEHTGEAGFDTRIEAFLDMIG